MNVVASRTASLVAHENMQNFANTESTNQLSNAVTSQMQPC